jgi:hypothetical protein
MHRSFWRYLVGEGEERMGSPDDRRRWEADAPPVRATTVHVHHRSRPSFTSTIVRATPQDVPALLATVTDGGAADVERLATAYALGRAQSADAIQAPGMGWAVTPFACPPPVYFLSDSPCKRNGGA